jgi:hypothetical protein
MRMFPAAEADMIFESVLIDSIHDFVQNGVKNYQRFALFHISKTFVDQKRNSRLRSKISNSFFGNKPQSLSFGASDLNSGMSIGMKSLRRLFERRIDSLFGYKLVLRVFENVGGIILSNEELSRGKAKDTADSKYFAQVIISVMSSRVGCFLHL